MNAYCPECETELDSTSGICPACRWDPEFVNGYRTVRRPRLNEGSITERYRGTPYDTSVQFAETFQAEPAISRGRLFVIIGLVAGIVLYGLVLASVVQF